jgi:hypothetical protein
MKKRHCLLIVAALLMVVALVVYRAQKPTEQVQGVTGVEPGVAGGESASTGVMGSQVATVEQGRDDGQRSSHQKMLDARLKELNMSPAVRAVLGLNVQKNDRDARHEALTKLTRTLSADDVEGLSIFLDFRLQDNDELSSAAFNAIKNDALVVIFSQKQVPSELGSQLVRMFKDEEHGTRWRDYSLQYMSQYYEEVSKPGDGVRAEITNAYAVALDSRSQKYAGTALMAVERLSRKNPEIDRQKIGDKAVEIALANDTCNDSRITALRVCAMMQRTEVLQQARMLAQTGETVPLRLAAIATVGDLGDASDLEYIESLGQSDDKRLQRISKTASATLRKRLGKDTDAKDKG